MPLQFNPFTGTFDVTTKGDTGTVAAAGDGTAAAPGITFASDTNTGIYRPGEDQLALSTGGTGRLFISSNGTITTSQSVAVTGGLAAWNAGLNLFSPGGGVGQIAASTDAAGTAGTLIFQTGSERLRITSTGQLSHIGAGSSGSPAVSFSGSAASNSLVVDSSSRVGIGTSSPSALLHVASTGAVESLISGGGTVGDTVLHIKGNANAYKFIVPNGATQYGMGLYDVGNAAYRLFVNSAGRVGIGTTSPSQKLSVEEAADTYALIKRTVSGSESTIFVGAESGKTVIYSRDNATGGRALEFTIGVTPAARIDTSGRLLVGTSSARAVEPYRNTTAGIVSQVLFENANAALTIVSTDNSTASFGPSLYLARTRGSSNQAVASGDSLGGICFAGGDDTDIRTRGASIDCEVDGTPGANDMPGRLVFSTTSDASASPTERLRITSAGVLQVADAGNIAVGTTTGTKIGTATTQKLGFFNKTPVVQPAAVADATDAASVITQLNALLARMRDLGLIAT